MDINAGATKLLYDPNVFQPPTFNGRYVDSMWDVSKDPIAILVTPAKSVWDQVLPYLQWFTTDNGLAVVTGVLLISAGVLAYKYLDKADTRGQGDMKHWERKQYLQRIFSDILTEVVEEAHYEDKITRAEKYQLYKGMANFFQLPDLVAAKSPARKKAEIKSRLGNGVYTVENRPSIPGEAPIQDITPVVRPVRNRLVLRKTLRTQPA